MPLDCRDALPLSATDLHILLVLAEQELYGYAILQAIERESRDLVRPDLGALYRALARLTTAGLVHGVPSPDDARPAPGKKRRYYGITDSGQQVLAAETKRLRSILDLAYPRLEARFGPSRQES